MIDPKNIDVEQSLSSGWLKGRFPLIDILSWIVTIVISASFFFMGIYFVLAGVRLNMDSMVIGMSLLSLVGAFLLYRTFIVHKLQKVETMMLAKDMRPLLIEYFTRHKHIVEFESEEILVIHDPGPEALLRHRTTKTTVILFRNCTLSFCSLTEGRGTTLPNIFGEWGLKKDLTALLN